MFFHCYLTLSKKPRDTRWAELRSSISQHLIKLASVKAVEWACQKSLGPLLIEIVRSAIGDVSLIYCSLCERLREPVEEEEEEGGHLVSDPCGHWVLKRLLAVGKRG